MKYVKKFDNFLNESNEFDTMRTEIENSLNVDLENLGENPKRMKLENIRNTIEQILDYYNNKFKGGVDDDRSINSEFKLLELIKEIEDRLFQWGAYGEDENMSFNQVKQDILDLIDSNKGDLF
jgi:hypothetical protein